MANKLKSLMDTLKVDSTSPWVNKDTLMKVMKAVEDDKNILNEVEVIEDDATTSFVFPKGVMPIRFYSSTRGGDYLFMNYSDGIILNGNGEKDDSWAYSYTSDGRIMLEYQSSGATINNIDELYFINVGGDADLSSAPNWYDILNPSTGGGGTQLYRAEGHIVRSGATLHFSYVTTYPDKPNANTLVNSLDGCPNSVHSGSNTDNLTPAMIAGSSNSNAITFIKYSLDGGYYGLHINNEDIYTALAANNIDTVTPL